ncbi:Tripartite motif-containing protein 16 Estrogen-responsive B box protein [Channa argus]|uniref:Tripartite motif-containing protein 16 Estrogen-responsive B box protein n=1 Tax=Channa argus TaxID=215402 RepID=A0A6G1R0D8_CHAAH|nr:Tripartite motif-containing protein 16 Estrogen-responsive B box protein [Channa argus]
MSQRSNLDLDKYSSLDKSRRSNQSRTQATSGEVLCDFCTTRKQKAEKSCLVCLASYCETHVQTHYDYPALMKHKLVKATGQMREKICAQHDKLLEAFCRTDQTSVCVLCMMDEHKHHDLVPAGTERTEKQKQLSTTLHKSQQRIDQRIKKWQDLRQAVESVKHSAQSVLEENERIFTELLLSIERKYNDVKEMIRSHEKATVSRAEILVNRLEEEITLLKKRHTDLEKLSHTDDHIHFLQSWQSLSGPSGYEDLNNISVAPYYSFDATKRAIAALKLQVEEVSKTEMSKVSGAVKEVYITQEGDTKTRRESLLRGESKMRDEPKTREDFLKYACQLILDVNSVHPNLHLSEGNRTVTMKSEPKNYPDHPDRFDHWQQVLCRDSVTGTRSYWEVDWRGTEIDVALTYSGIRRKGNGNECSLGWNDKSWSLYCSESKYSFVHNNKSKEIAATASPRIGVYVDRAAGTIAFYSVSDGMQLLHRVQTTFTEPLYPAFSVWGFSTTIRL